MIGLAAGFHGLGDGHDHAAVLEGAGGVAAFQLEIQLARSPISFSRAASHQRRIAFAQGRTSAFWASSVDILCIAQKLQISFHPPCQIFPNCSHILA